MVTVQFFARPCKYNPFLVGNRFLVVNRNNTFTVVYDSAYDKFGGAK